MCAYEYQVFKCCWLLTVYIRDFFYGFCTNHSVRIEIWFQITDKNTANCIPPVSENITFFAEDKEMVLQEMSKHRSRVIDARYGYIGKIR